MTTTSHIVVDASVAMSVGELASDSVAAACRSLVNQLSSKECSTGILMTPAVRAEWKKHVSALMSSWLVSMVSRGRVREERDRVVRDLRDAVAAVKDSGVRVALQKDLHLSEAAIFYGAPIASRDDKQRKYLAIIGTTYLAASRIQWLNPVHHDQVLWMNWVTSGCTDRDIFRVSDGTVLGTLKNN